MINFKYAAKGPSGKTVEGNISATSKAEAVAELRRQNLVVMRLDATKGGGAKSRVSFSNITIGGLRVKKSEVVDSVHAVGS